MNILKFKAYLKNFNKIVKIGCIEFIDGKLDHIHLENGMMIMADDLILLQYTQCETQLEKVEIYEGDIVYIAGKGNCLISIDIYGVRAEIINNTGMVTEDEFLLAESLMENDVEKVLGNKHLNPELMKV